MNFVQDKVTHICLHNYRTEVKNFGRKPRYIIAYVLNLGYVEIDHTLAE